MEKTAEHHVSFVVFDFGDNPAVVSQMIGIEPTRAWIRGDPIPNTRHGRHVHSRWVLQSPLPLVQPIEAHLCALLPRLERRREAIREVRQSFQAQLAVAAYWYDVNPGFQLSA